MNKLRGPARKIYEFIIKHKSSENLPDTFNSPRSLLVGSSIIRGPHAVILECSTSDPCRRRKTACRAQEYREMDKSTERV